MDQIPMTEVASLVLTGVVLLGGLWVVRWHRRSITRAHLEERLKFGA